MPDLSKATSTAQWIGARVALVILTFALIVIFAGQSFAEVETGTKKILDIQEVKSDLGITAWLVEDHSAPVISIDFWFHPDTPLYSAEKQGITSFLSSMLDEGAGDYPSQDFQKMLEDYNISMSFNGGRDAFGGSLYVLSKYKDKAAELLGLALTKPRFDAEPMERMRRSHITRLRRSLGDPGWTRARLTNVYSYPDHYYALNSGGTMATLTAMNPDDLRNFMTQYFNRETLEVSVVGDITAQDLKSLLDKMFGTLPAAAPAPQESIKAPEFPAAPPKIYFEKDIPQTYLRYVWDGIDSHDPDYPAYAVMEYILGGGGFSSRLMTEIREKRGLTYGVYSGMMTNDKADRLHIDTSTAHENIAQMRALILAEIRRMVDEPVGAQELADAKSYLTGSMVLGLTSTGSIVGAVSGLQYNDRPMDYLDGFKARVNGVTAEAIQNVARRVFDGKAPIEIYVGLKPDLGAESGAPVEQVTTLPNAE